MAEAIYPVPPGFHARIGPGELAELNDLAAADPDRFWLDQARRLTWNKFPTEAGDWSFDEDDFHIRWYADGELNLSVNCLDRHLAEHGDRTALIFEADEPGQGHTSPIASCTRKPAASRTCSSRAASGAATAS